MKFNPVAKISLILISAAVLITTPSAQAGDVIDFLPEVVLARSLAIAEEFVSVPLELCEEFDPAQEIEDHVLFDDNGQRWSVEESRQIIIDINCLIQELQLNVPNEIAFSNTPRFFDVLAGERVEFQNGIVIDGRKQSVRIALVLPTLFIFQGELFGGLFDFGFLGFDPCEPLRDWALNGPSLEIQWAAFVSLAVEVFAEGEVERQCTEPVSGTPEEILELVKMNDLDAAFQIAFNLQFEYEELFGDPTAEDIPALEAELFDLQLFILSITMKYPLLTLVYSLPLSSIESFLFELRG